MRVDTIITAMKKPRDKLDEGQKRMNDAAEALFATPEIHNRVHEFDDECQPDNEAKRM